MSRRRRRAALGVGVAAGVDEVADLAVAAAGEADESFGVGAQRLEGDEGRPLALGVGQVGGGEEAAEVGVALAGLGEEDQVVRVVGGAGAGRRWAPRLRGAAPRRRPPGSSDSTRTSAPKIGLMPRLAQALAKRTAP